MGLVAIEGMKFYAFHGYYDEEQLIGGEYVVDVYVEVNTKKAGISDELSDTVNYENIYRITKVEMGKKSRLIETVAQRIVDRVKSMFNNIVTLKVRLSKLHPPLGSTVARTFIELEENYLTSCGKCKRSFLSHAPGDCWTKHGKVYPETQSTLMRTYGKNICKKCLSPYFIKARES